MAVDLKKIPLFGGVDEAALQALAARALVRTLPADSVIFKEGDVPDALYVVLSGRVKIYLGEDGARELVLSHKGPGDYFGEMMLDDRPRSASVMTVEPSQFAVLSRELFTAFLLEHPRVALQIIRDLIRVGRGMNVRTRDTFRQNLQELEQRKFAELAAARRARTAKSVVFAAAVIFLTLQFYFLFAR